MARIRLTPSEAMETRKIQFEWTFPSRGGGAVRPEGVTLPSGVNDEKRWREERHALYKLGSQDHRDATAAQIEKLLICSETMSKTTWL